MNPRISVIIPAFNEEKVLPKCLKALRDQTYPDEKYEVIVVDNGSKDRTSEIAREYGARPLLFEASHRVGAVRNYGVSKAHGEVFAFMDADSYPAKDWLEQIEKEFEAHPDVVSVCGVGLSMNNAAYLRFMYFLYDLAMIGYNFFGFVFAWGFNIAIKKDAYEAIHGFSETITAFDDGDVGLRLQKKFGRRKVIYCSSMKVYTSTRKQEDVKNFFSYMGPATMNHFSMVFLGRVWATELKTVR